MTVRETPSGKSSEGAHWSAIPVVPWATESTGRGPSASPDGAAMIPVTSIGSPATDVDR